MAVSHPSALSITRVAKCLVVRSMSLGLIGAGGLGPSLGVVLFASGLNTGDCSVARGGTGGSRQQEVGMWRGSTFIIIFFPKVGTIGGRPSALSAILIHGGMGGSPNGKGSLMGGTSLPLLIISCIGGIGGSPGCSSTVPVPGLVQFLLGISVPFHISSCIGIISGALSGKGSSMGSISGADSAVGTGVSIGGTRALQGTGGG